MNRPQPSSSLSRGFVSRGGRHKNDVNDPAEEANVAATHALKIVGGYLYQEPNMVATDKGDPEWDALLARTMRALKADGTLAKISQHWFQTDITHDDP